MMKMKKYFV